MKFWKWFAFIDEGSSEERIRAEYRQIPDKHLAQIDPGVLTALGLKVYREELARRKPAASSVPLDSQTDKVKVA